MSAVARGQRVVVFVVFAALAASVAAALRSGNPGSAPSTADLAALEKKMTVAARLHPAPAVPAPAGPASWCSGCHPGHPHPGTSVAAAMLNEHASCMDCLLCHWSAAGGSRPPPLWQAQAGTAPFLAVLPAPRVAKEELARLRAAVTANRRCFERGPECRGCHRPGGIGALLRPGSDPGRSTALEKLEIYFTLAPGEKWYLPQLQ